MNKKKVSQALTRVLADTFVLYFKTHSFHWNVTGGNFRSLHALFEEQYTETWEATDEIAERIRALGEFAPNSHAALMKNAALNDNTQTPDSDGMCEILAADNRAIVKTITDALKISQEAGDEASADLMISRIKAHEKAAWMLESSRAA